MTVVVGVDSSTSACKVEVRDADSGTLVASGRAPHPATTPPRSEQDPHDWEQAFDEACAQAGVPDIHRPAAIAVGAQQHGMVVLDGQREVLRPAKLWNDTESAPQAARLVEEVGAEKWAALTGSVPVASFTVTKLAWLREHEREVFDRVRHVVLPHDWLTFRLAGELVTDRGDASGTGYWSPATGAYSDDILELIGLDAAMTPTVLGPSSAAGTWGDAVVGPGTGDNMAAALGLGLAVGDVAISLGTSGTVFAVSERGVADATGVVAGFADATGHYLPLVCTLNATKVTDTVARLLGMSLADLDRHALSTEPGAGGVVMVPYLDGERTPNRPTATGTLHGLRSDVEPQHLARAAFEAVVCSLLDALDGLRAAGVPVDDGRLVLVGGGARSDAYRRILADLAQRPVVVPATEEHVALGACVQAAAVLAQGDIADINAAWSLGAGDTVEPDARVDAAAVRAAYAARTGGEQ
jgi:xylulokinase